jgi:hypothetical protein
MLARLHHVQFNAGNVLLHADCTTGPLVTARGFRACLLYHTCVLPLLADGFEGDWARAEAGMQAFHQMHTWQGKAPAWQ